MMLCIALFAFDYPEHNEAELNLITTFSNLSKVESLTNCVFDKTRAAFLNNIPKHSCVP